jgi:hypothetical protein
MPLDQVTYGAKETNQLQNESRGLKIEILDTDQCNVKEQLPTVCSMENNPLMPELYQYVNVRGCAGVDLYTWSRLGVTVQRLRFFARTTMRYSTATTSMIS